MDETARENIKFRALLFCATPQITEHLEEAKMVEGQIKRCYEFLIYGYFHLLYFLSIFRSALCGQT